MSHVFAPLFAVEVVIQLDDVVASPPQVTACQVIPPVGAAFAVSGEATPGVVTQVRYELRKRREEDEVGGPDHLIRPVIVVRLDDQASGRFPRRKWGR